MCLNCDCVCTALIVGLVCSLALIVGSVVAVLALVFFRRLVHTEQPCCRPLLCTALGGNKRYRDPSVCLSRGAAACLGYRHIGCLQLSHRRLPEMCRLRSRPRTDIDPLRFLDPRWPDWRRNDMPPSNCHRRGAFRRPGAITSSMRRYASAVDAVSVCHKAVFYQNA